MLADTDAVDILIWDGSLDLADAAREAAAATHGGPIMGAGRFDTKFRQSPLGPAIVALGVDGPEVAGMVAFGRYRLDSAAGVIDAGISYETFVHPDHQRRGLFTRLLAAAEQAAVDTGIMVLFNFPNPNSRPGFEHGGWRERDKLVTLVRPMRARRILEECVRRPLSLRRFRPESAAEAGTGISLQALTNLHALPMTRSGLRRHHDVEFLQWRLRSTGHDYRLLTRGRDAAIVRTGRRSRLREVQLLGIYSSRTSRTDTEVIRSALQEIESNFHPDTVSILLSRSAGYLPALLRRGFVPVPNQASFYAKPLEAGCATGRWSVDGLDIHTW